MAKVARILKDGKKMDYVATADVVNGDVVEVGSIIGVVHDTVLSGETCAMDYTGTIEIGATVADAFAQGEIIYFDPATDLALHTQTVAVEPILGVVVSGKAGAVAGTIEVDMSVRA